MRCLFLFAVAALLCSAQSASVPPLPAGDCSWEGSVEDAFAHTPVDHAVVSLSLIESRPSRDQYVSHAMSDSDGHWKIFGVVCKSVVVNATKPGYVKWPLRPGAVDVAPVMVGREGKPTGNPRVRIQLAPESAFSSVSGSVLDDAGKPIPTAQIAVVSFVAGNGVANNGRRVRREAPLIVPDLKGAFGPSALPPDAQEVCAADEPGPADGPWTHYSRSCSPSPGRGEKKEIQFVLHRIAGVHVRGKLAGCASNCTISLRQFNEVTNTRAKQDMAPGTDGSFSFAGVPPGEYSLFASSGGMTAYLPVTIADADVGGLQLKLAAPVDVHGTVHYPAGFSDAAYTEISLQSLSPLSARTGSLAWNANLTSFVFRGVEPGRFEFSFRIRNAFARSAMLNGTDILDSEFQVEDGMPSIDVIVDDKLAGIEGTTVNAQGDSVNSAVYMMQAGRKPIIGYSSFGAFVGRIPPGEYSVYAFPSGSPIYYLEPDWMDKYGRDPQRVTVSVDRVVKIRLVERAVDQ